MQRRGVNMLERGPTYLDPRPASSPYHGFRDRDGFETGIAPVTSQWCSDREAGRDAIRWSEALRVSRGYGASQVAVVVLGSSRFSFLLIPFSSPRCRDGGTVVGLAELSSSLSP
jgi:hypothetical protein